MTTLPENDSVNKRSRARLALTDEKAITDWREKEEYLERRKAEAAKAMASDEQKKIREEAEKAKLHKLEAQKKLAELEANRQAEDVRKTKDIAGQQREKDLKQEKIRQEKIKEILQSQKEIAGIKKSPQSRLSSVRTLTDDLSEAIKNKGFTATHLAQANNQELKENDRPVSWKKTIILSLSLIFILGGATTIMWSFWQRQEKSRAPTQLQHDSIIFADEHLRIDLKNKTADQIKQELVLIKNQSGNNLDRERIKDIYFVFEQSRVTDQGLVIEKKIADPSIFASSTNLLITDDLLRFLKTDFMLGLYVGPQTEPFYIFKTDAYKNSADALLKQENEIVSQLLSLFIEPETKLQIRLTPFKDKMFKNRDLRVVTNSDNETLAVYTWFNKNTIVVTTSELALEKILIAFLTPKPVTR